VRPYPKQNLLKNYGRRPITGPSVSIKTTKILLIPVSRSEVPLLCLGPGGLEGLAGPGRGA